MPDGHCQICGKPIRMQIYKNTGYCCEQCKDKAKNTTIQE